MEIPSQMALAKYWNKLLTPYAKAEPRKAWFQLFTTGGLFVATYENIPVGTGIAVTVKLPDHDPIQAEGTVCWIREHSDFTEDVSPGFGVQFTDLKQADRELIETDSDLDGLREREDFQELVARMVDD